VLCTRDPKDRHALRTMIKAIGNPPMTATTATLDGAVAAAAPVATAGIIHRGLTIIAFSAYRFTAVLAVLCGSPLYTAVASSYALPGRWHLESEVLVRCDRGDANHGQRRRPLDSAIHHAHRPPSPTDENSAARRHRASGLLAEP